MTITVTDLFAGAGGSSLGAEAAGTELKLAVNHWPVAMYVHEKHFTNATHDIADISQVDPRRYPRTDILLASPSCTSHSLAKGIPLWKQERTATNIPDPEAEKSRATMWDVPRFAEHHRYETVIVENVVEASKWIMFPAWWQAMQLLGYAGQILSHNSQDHDTPQSRDRIYIVWTLGKQPDFTFNKTAYCNHCQTVTSCTQTWKPGRTVGRYNQQWYWGCENCGTKLYPETPAANQIIDWNYPIHTIGERKRPLVNRTRERIAAGIRRHHPDSTPLLMRNNNIQGNPGFLSTPVTEPARTMTTAGHQSLLVPDPTANINNTNELVDSCKYRMIQPHEVAGAMGFPKNYIPTDLPKADQNRLAGNAVTPNAMKWIVSKVTTAMNS